MNYIRIAFLASCMFLLFGCFEDEGNYDYIELNDIEISGIESSYNAYILDTLRIKPELSFAIDDQVELSYEWRLGKDKIICTEKNLEFVIPSDIASLEHILFSVRENGSGLTKQASISLTSKQLFTSGWLILSDKDGKSSLAFIRRDWVEDKNGEGGYKFTEFHDVYSNIMNEDLGTGPLQIQEHWRSRAPYGDGRVMLVQKGGQGCVDLFAGNLAKSLNTTKEFISLPESYAPKEVMYGEEFSYIVNSDGRLFSRKNNSKEVFYSGYFSNYPVAFEENGKSTELNVDRFVPNFNYRNCGFVLAYEKVNKRFLLISEFTGYKEDTSGKITSLESNNYENSAYVPMHNVGDNFFFYGSAYDVRSWGYTGFYSIFKTPEGNFIEQQLELMFDKYGSGAVTITPKSVRDIPSAFIDDNSIVDVPDGGGGYGSTNIYISKGNMLNYYNRLGGETININNYYSFDSDVVAIDDQHYQNKLICVGLANGDIYVMDVSDEAIAGRQEKVLYKIKNKVGDVKQVLFKRGAY